MGCSVRFELQHNVCGRRVYAEGTADAVEFLVKQRAAGGSKRRFDMIDVLESGQMK
jgi:4-hydroxy-tetrahydrodipicolinate reductase